MLCANPIINGTHWYLKADVSCFSGCTGHRHLWLTTNLTVRRASAAMSVGSLRLLRTAGFSRLDNRARCQQSSARLIPPVLQSMSRLVLVLWTQSRRTCFASRYALCFAEG